MLDAEEVVGIAKAIERDDPIDWGMLRIDEDDTYNLMAQSVITQTEGETRERLLGMITKLYVENLVLSLHLFGIDKTNK